ncbi:30S ribosomal protein S9 [Patescibacteria group bacterium]|nr:30S ribosomal protein S9 [Patescibacteria group bacterium]
MPKTTAKKDHYTFAVGRRKSAIATVKLFPGKGESKVNNQSVDKYFSAVFYHQQYNKPFEVTHTADKFYYSASVSGGGKNGQIEALTVALSRALKEASSEYTAPLRAASLVTIDARVRERRKIGTGGKARRAKQSPKR